MAKIRNKYSKLHIILLKISDRTMFGNLQISNKLPNINPARKFLMVYHKLKCFFQLQQ